MAVFRSIRTILTIRCRETTEHLSASLEEPLGPVERWAVRLHLMVCAGCRNYRRQLRELTRLLEEAELRAGDSPEAARLSDQARRRLRHAMGLDED